jgi:hypothetical protein
LRQSPSATSPWSSSMLRASCRPIAGKPVRRLCFHENSG